MEYSKGVELLFDKLGTHKIMALAASVDDVVTVRNVSCIIYDNKIYFKTDKNFRKTRLLMQNPNIALCVDGISIEGTANNVGLVVEEPDRKFEKLYEKYWAKSYNAYPHVDSEILIEVTPRFAEVWDQRENGYGFQVFIDLQNKTAVQEDYDL